MASAAQAVTPWVRSFAVEMLEQELAQPEFADPNMPGSSWCSIASPVLITESQNRVEDAAAAAERQGRRRQARAAVAQRRFRAALHRPERVSALFVPFATCVNSRVREQFVRFCGHDARCAHGARAGARLAARLQWLHCRCFAPRQGIRSQGLAHLAMPFANSPPPSMQAAIAAGVLQATPSSPAAANADGSTGAAAAAPSVVASAQNFSTNTRVLLILVQRLCALASSHLLS